MKNYGDGRGANMDALKSIITDYKYRVGEKYMPKHDV
jgi:hypothetical protein